MVHEDQPKARSVAVVPPEVIENRPDELAFFRHTLVHGLFKLKQVVRQVADAAFVVDAAIRPGRIRPDCLPDTAAARNPVCLSILG